MSCEDGLKIGGRLAGTMIGTVLSLLEPKPVGLVIVVTS